MKDEKHVHYHHPSIRNPKSAFRNRLTVAAASLTLACVGTPEIPFPESSYEDVTPPVGGQAGDFSPDNPPWGVLGAFGVWVASFIFMFVTQFVCIFGLIL